MRHLRPARVILFGSRARGDHRPKSDIDASTPFVEGLPNTIAWWREHGRPHNPREGRASPVSPAAPFPCSGSCLLLAAPVPDVASDAILTVATEACREAVGRRVRSLARPSGQT